MFDQQDFRRRKELKLWQLVECPTCSLSKTCLKRDHLEVNHCWESERLYYGDFSKIVINEDEKDLHLTFGSGKALKKLVERATKFLGSGKTVYVKNLSITSMAKKNKKKKKKRTIKPRTADIYCSNTSEFFMLLPDEDKEKEQVISTD